MKEFIIANANREDLCYLSANCGLDIDIGTDNDFQLTVPMSEYDSEIYKAGNILYCPGTELGGILHDMEVNTSDNTIIFTGDTPRGMMAKKIIEPPSGSDYRTYRQPIGTLSYSMISLYPFGELITAGLDTSTSLISGQFERYCTMLDGLKKAFMANGYKIEIKAEYLDNKVTWKIYTAPIKNYSDSIEVSQDCNIDFKIKVKTNLYTHMICAGQGDLKDRMIVHLYLHPDGSITEEQWYAGVEDKDYFYDYSSVEGETQEQQRINLLEEGKKKFAEINATDTQEMTFSGLETLGVSIGDIVGGREYMTGISIRENVTGFIYKVQNGIESTEIKVGE